MSEFGLGFRGRGKDGVARYFCDHTFSTEREGTEQWDVLSRRSGKLEFRGETFPDGKAWNYTVEKKILDGRRGDGRFVLMGRNGKGTVKPVDLSSL